nr:N-acetylmuramidase domain-containing protein [Burkholderia glumae]
MKAFMAVVKAGSAFASTVKDENFAAFAKSCNGPAYYDNNNDGKMKINFKKFEKADAARKEAK